VAEEPPGERQGERGTSEMACGDLGDDGSGDSSPESDRGDDGAGNLLR
jgi:hypothetical protein